MKTHHALRLRQSDEKLLLSCRPDRWFGLVLLLDSEVRGLLNLGSLGEFTMIELANLVLAATGSTGSMLHLNLLIDDPSKRKLTLLGQTSFSVGFPRLSYSPGRCDGRLVCETEGRPNSW
jgi:hypothetical protein